jgi:hypothetical protein
MPLVSVQKTVTMKKWCVVVGLFITANGVAQVKTNLWDLFAKTKFESKFDEKIGEYLFYPNFSADLKTMAGKEVTLQGYYVPFTPEGEKYVILSKYPMSQCFFCGGGGPESVAEINFGKDSPDFDIDDLVTVKGKLRLNTESLDHLKFILDQAVFVSKE